MLSENAIKSKSVYYIGTSKHKTPSGYHYKLVLRFPSSFKNL